MSHRESWLKLKIRFSVPRLSWSSFRFFTGLLSGSKPQELSYQTSIVFWGFSVIDNSILTAFSKDWHHFSSTLCQPDSYTDLSVDQLQEMYDITLPLLLDKHAPLRTVRKRYQPLTPWFDAECATSRRKSRLFERRYRSTKSAADRLAWTNQVRRMHHLYDRKQNSYWEAKVNDSQGNPKKLWRTLSQVLCKDRTRTTTSTDGLTAEGFSKAFLEKVETVRSKTSHALRPSFDGVTCTSHVHVSGIYDGWCAIRSTPDTECAKQELWPWPSSDLGREAIPWRTFSVHHNTFQCFLAWWHISNNSEVCIGHSSPQEIQSWFHQSQQLQTNFESVVLVKDAGALCEWSGKCILHEKWTATGGTISVQEVPFNWECRPQSSIGYLLRGRQGKGNSSGSVGYECGFWHGRSCYPPGATALQIWIRRCRLEMVLLLSHGSHAARLVRWCDVVCGLGFLWCCVPQGSVLGPVLFLVYSADAIAISDKHGFSAHVYADDMQLYDHADQHNCASLIVRLSTCVGEISEWMASNRLCLNPMKTEIIWLGSTRRIANCPVDPQDIAGAMIVPSKLIRDLGVMVDDDLTLTAHVSHLSSSCFYQLRQLRAIRRSLSTDTAHALVCALVHSRDSCYTNQNYWSTWFFICLSVGLERCAYAFERPFHHFHNFQKTAENFFILKVLITV